MQVTYVIDILVYVSFAIYPYILLTFACSPSIPYHILCRYTHAIMLFLPTSTQHSITSKFPF
jgi:hypothetical protein